MLPFIADLGKSDVVGGISNCQFLQLHATPLGLPCVAGVAEEFGPLSALVPLHADVWSFVVNGKLTVKYLLGTEAGYQWWSLCFHHHGNYETRFVQTEEDETELFFYLNTDYYMGL